jgi:hypothetical protein
LYDLIAAVNAEVDAKEDDLVIDCVMHLLNTQRLTFQGVSVPRRLITAHPLAPRRRNPGTTRRRPRGSPNALRASSCRLDVGPSPCSLEPRRPPANV